MGKIARVAGRVLYFPFELVGNIITHIVGPCFVVNKTNMVHEELHEDLRDREFENVKLTKWEVYSRLHWKSIYGSTEDWLDDLVDRLEDADMKVTVRTFATKEKL